MNTLDADATKALIRKIGFGALKYIRLTNDVVRFVHLTEYCLDHSDMVRDFEIVMSAGFIMFEGFKDEISIEVPMLRKSHTLNVGPDITDAGFIRDILTVA